MLQSIDKRIVDLRLDVSALDNLIVDLNLSVVNGKLDGCQNYNDKTDNNTNRLIH